MQKKNLVQILKSEHITYYKKVQIHSKYPEYKKKKHVQILKSIIVQTALFLSSSKILIF